MAIRNAVATLCIGASCAGTIAMPVVAAPDLTEAFTDVDASVQQLALIVPQSGPAAARLPDDAQLLRLRAVIGRIDIEVDDVFETGHSLAAPYRLANALHISTKRQTIADQLLFHSGEPYSRHALDETARLLRDQRYLNEATIEPVRYHDDNTVDVVVRVHDVWTLSPGFSFGRKGGANSTSLEFEDTNFLGFGKQISVDRSSDVDRSSWRLAYKDPNLFGTWWRLSAAHADMSDGSEDALAISRPFYSLDSRWSFNVEGSDTAATQSRYALGHIVDQFGMQRQLFEVGGGLSRGLVDGWTTRYLGGVRYEKRAFSALPNPIRREAVPNAITPGAITPDAITPGAMEGAINPGATTFIPQDRVLAYPWLGIEVIEDEYRTTRNLDQIGRTEDLYLGRSARFEAGYAASAFGSTRDALMFDGSLQAGMAFTEDQYLINTVGFTGRVEQGALRNTVLDLGSRYYLRQSLRSVLFASATLSFTSDLDPEEQLLLGGDNGLRGYPLRYQAGTSHALFTLEERFYTNWQPLKLFNVGAAVFFDAGRSWGTAAYLDETGAAESQGWLKDVGVGLRLGSARSGLGNVLHIDLACPLDGGDDIDSVQLLIETRRSF